MLNPAILATNTHQNAEHATEGNTIGRSGAALGQRCASGQSDSRSGTRFQHRSDRRLSLLYTYTSAYDDYTLISGEVSLLVFNGGLVLYCIVCLAICQVYLTFIIGSGIMQM